ncbi:MAG: hypothetical protein FWD67_04050 [Betaproteobacteria bacterium]|nr:hypothetical protein [Betaproteobacteria bacterium]
MQLKPLCRKASALILLALAATTIHAEDALLPTAQTVQALMLEAIRSEAGVAHGVLTGGVADALTQKFGGTSPITVDVSTEKRYRQPGCSRLKVLFQQEGVRLPENKEPRTQTVEIGINYCLDGKPPKSLQ